MALVTACRCVFAPNELLQVIEYIHDRTGSEGAQFHIISLRQLGSVSPSLRVVYRCSFHHPFTASIYILTRFFFINKISQSAVAHRLQFVF